MPKVKETVRVTVRPMSDLDIRIYKCEVCHKAFARNAALGAHKFRSHGIRGRSVKAQAALPAPAVTITQVSIWEKIDPRLRKSVRAYLKKYRLPPECVQVGPDGTKVLIHNKPTEKRFVDID